MKHILVVDDDSMNCALAKHVLCQNYEVSTVFSGEEALEFLEKQVPNLILMDVDMPRMGGIEVARRIKENQDWAKIPIIFITSNSDPATEVECLKLGADDFITKPFVPIVMNSRVSKILELQDFRQDLEEQLEVRTKQVELATLKSLTDPLTGLNNRECLVKKMEELQDAGYHGSLFMIDLDNFKQINDTFGHIVGDKTLQLFADVLRSNSREQDLVCRLAGDEFVVFYTDMVDKEKAAKKAEGIISLFSEKIASLGYGGIVSVSIGIVICEEKGEEFQELYRKADKSLYFVKNNGKNAYHFYSKNKENINEINTVVDLEYISHMMEEGMDTSKGAFNLAYDEFKKIYDFVSRSVNRKHQQVQIVLFTLKLGEMQRMGSMLEDAMHVLEKSIVTSLRAMDAGTKYSNSQYIAIFMDTDLENGKMVAERIIHNFLDKYSYMDMDIDVMYDIRTLEPKANE